MKTIIALFVMAALSACSVNSSKKPNDEAMKFGIMYKELIQAELIFPDDGMGKECLLSIQLSETGEITQLTSSGDELLCSAGEKAVNQVGKFPMPADKDKSVIDELRTIKLTLSPVNVRR
ncbi:cell envelope integrity protein TolA [Veronia pacifica]|uniref:TonB C-terminal domain-containing protein n=1 Tax=Veronia pacifica TaxID=1080227 RepID=A0A1C3EC11_9GAMM|nr:cell envelope integrity protein TolA [Veronia pacifica]ODA30797.1 hypothetical protein A8L45_19295 [Veronia pacifica]